MLRGDRIFSSMCTQPMPLREREHGRIPKACPRIVNILLVGQGPWPAGGLLKPPSRGATSSPCILYASEVRFSFFFFTNGTGPPAL